MISRAQAADAQSKLESELGAQLGCAFGLMRDPKGNEDWCIIAYLIKNEDKAKLPPDKEGVKVFAEVTGGTQAFAK